MAFHTIYFVYCAMSRFFFFNDTATTDIYTLSLHDALPISAPAAPDRRSTAHGCRTPAPAGTDRKSTRLNSSHQIISYAVFCLKKKKLYYQRQSDEMRQRHIAGLIALEQPFLVVAGGIDAPADLVLRCTRSSTPLLTTPLPAATVIDRLRSYISRIFAPRTTLHGVFLDILGMGVLLAGESGLGKSELGLELISRGHGLVADD